MLASFKIKTGDRVIYLAQKCGPRPSASARQVMPSKRGEDYHYYVPKYWVVDQVKDQVVVIRTRKGKRREVSIHDPRLRRASLLERFFYDARFPEISAEQTSTAWG